MTSYEILEKQREILMKINELYGDMRASYERGDFSLESLVKYQLDSTKLLAELCLYHWHPIV